MLEAGGNPPASKHFVHYLTLMAQTVLKTEKKTESTEPRVRIKIFSYDNKIIDEATKIIMDTAERNNAKVVGPVPLPTEKRNSV